MKSLLFSILTIFGLYGTAFAQLPKSTTGYSSFVSMYSNEGDWGAGICYNPKKNLYYSAYSKSEALPIEVFNSDLEYILSGPIKASINCLWFNSKSNKIEGILSDKNGVFSIDLDENGIPNKINLIDRKYPHSINHSAAFNNEKQEIYFVEDLTLFTYKSTSTHAKKIKLSGYAESGYLETTPVYTGVPGYEIGLLGLDGKLYLFNIKTGKQTAQILTDELVRYDTYRSNLSIINKELYMFNNYEFTWTGYTIFN